MIESSDFSLFKRDLDGEDLDPILSQRARLGFNTLRVWLLNQSVIRWRNGFDDAQRLHPADYPDFYPRLGPFAARCAAFGLYVEFTIFTSTGTLMPREEDQQSHLTLTQQALRGVPCLLELVNEADQYDNAPRPGLIAVQFGEGPPISRGSNGADSPPPRHDSPWDYECYHTNGLEEFQRKVGHNAMEWANESGKPCLSNENTRYPDNDSSPIHAEDAAENGALLCAGSCFHSEEGKGSRLFTGVTLTCAEAWARGARKVPLEYQRGIYKHEQELEAPGGYIRVHSRRLPDGRKYYSNVRP